MCSGSSDNFWYVLSSRIRDTNVLSDSISVKKLQRLGKPKATELIKHHDDKERSYDIVPLDWSINNYDVYNRNGLIETVIFYTYIIFYLTSKFKK
jgi:hypothetical protein